MSKADYPYPEDEFDAISPDAPTGVHRAPRSAWSRWWPFLVILLVVPVLAYGTVEVLSRSGDLPLAGGSSAGAPQDPADAGEEPAADEGAADEGAGDEGAGDGAEPGGEAEAPPPEAPQPVLTTPVAVLNGARVPGLAARVADQLTGAGFTAVTPDNASEPLPAQSTVYIGSEDLRSTGDLVASTVGVTAVEVAPDRAGAGIALVLVADPAA